MAKNEKKGLGRGLGALFGDDIDIARTRRKQASGTETAGNVKDPETGAKDSDVSRETSLIRLSLIEPNSSQPRKVFDEESLKELTESIRAHGVLQPILVQDRKDHYEIIAGERRWRAARIAGLKEVPVIIRDYSDREIVELSLIENIQREDLNPIEEALAYQRLSEEFGLKQEEIAQKVSKNRTTVTNSLRLLKLSKKVLAMVEGGEISAGHARALIPVTNEKQQYELAKKVRDEALSVRDTEKLVAKALKGAPEPKLREKDAALELIFKQLEEKMRRSMGTKVSIRQTGKDRGRIEIEYYSNDDLERITNFLT